MQSRYNVSKHVMRPHIVRYPRRTLLSPALFFVISGIGLANAMNGTRSRFLDAAFFALLGGFSLFYFLISRTVFSSDEVKQRNGIGQTVRYRYADIQRVELGGRDGNALFLSTTDGRRIKVCGTASQLVAARKILLKRLPQCFDAQYKGF